MNKNHIHKAHSIHWRGKVDSVYVDCECGATECIGVWFDRPPKNWSKKQWSLLHESILYFLDSFNRFRKENGTVIEWSRRKVK